jgi:hypothetical protein
MMKQRFITIFCFVFLMSGCAGNMALTKGQTDIDLSSKSIALLTVKISNQNNASRQVNLNNIIICPESDMNCRKDISSYPGGPYKIYKKEKNYFNEYLLSFALESGRYNIEGFYTTYNIPLLVAGVGYCELKLETNIKPNSITYLGHLNVTLREKTGNTETSAGNDTPHLDQALPGFSSGTFDVVVEDKFDEDMKSFISEYPALQQVKVEKSILPEWIRPEKRNQP